MKKSLPFLILSLLFLTTATAQEAQRGSNDDRWYDNWTVKPILGVQTWATYTFGHEDFDVESGQYVSTSDRLNIMLRRLRFGTTAQVGDRLFIKFLGAADFVGTDQRAGTVGGENNGGFPNAQIWDVFAQYKISRNTEGLYVVGGYLRPCIGRESMSGAFGVSSFEKMWTQWYVRQHLVGTGPGGTGGIYLGGLKHLGEKVHVDYRGGVFNAQNNGISAGRESSSLFAGRVNFMFGDAENDLWTYGLPNANSFGKRHTVAVALNLATEGSTGSASDGTGLVGVDALINFGMFHAEGEYHRMTRGADGFDDYSSATYGVRVGYSFTLTRPGDENRPSYLEPSVMVYGFSGAEDLDEYAAVVATNYFGGTERVIDVGLNYHLKPGKVRLSLHYVNMDGSPGDLPEDGRLTWYNRQGGIGGIRRGDYLGAEVVLSY